MELRIGVFSGPLSLDPHFHNEHNTFSILGNVYESLVSLDTELRLRPSLAESWENPTELTWVFHLRRDVLFHDGRKLTADDVVFSLNRTRFHPQATLSSYLVNVQEIRAVASHTVEITTTRPYAMLLNKLSFLMIVPRGAPHEILEPVGTGPFRFVRDELELLELARFSDYWRQASPFEKVFFVKIPNHEERVRQLLDHRVDLAVALRLEDRPSFREDGQARWLDRESLVIEYLLGPMDRAPFSDPRIRRAISLAIDREALVKEVAGGFGMPANQMVGRNIFGYSPDLPPLLPDREAARALMAEAGYEDGFDLVLDVRQGRPGYEQIAEQLSAIGIRTEIRTSAWSELFERLEAGDLELYFGGVLAISADASDVLDSKLHSKEKERGYGTANFNSYSNPELDAMIEEAGTILDMKERRDALQRCMAIAAEDLPLIPLFVPRDFYGLRTDLVWTPRLDGRIFAYEVQPGPGTPR